MIINDKQDAKSWYWFIEIYPDSVDPDYENILRKQCITCAISPWHDKDVNNLGEPLKPHKHILLVFSGSTRLPTVERIAESINAKTDVMIVRNKQAAYLYLFHSDNPDKALYLENDVTFINCDKYLFLNSAYKDILNYIDDYNCISLHQLTKKLRQDNQDNLLQYVSQNCYYVQSYLTEHLNKQLAKCYTCIGYIQDMYQSLIDYNYIDVQTLMDLYEKFKTLGIEKFVQDVGE